MTEDSLYNYITNQINEHLVKGVDRDNLYLIIQPDDKDKLTDWMDVDMTGLNKIHGVTVWCTHRHRSSPTVINVEAVQDLLIDQLKDGNE